MCSTVSRIRTPFSSLKSNLGDLTDLETTAKSDLVSAINEAASSGGTDGAGVADIRADINPEYIYEGDSSNSVDININAKLGDEGFVIGEKYNILTGETETSANENRTILIRVKPGSRVQPRSKNNVKSVVCFNRFGEFVSGFAFTNQDAYTIPDDIWYIGLTGGSGFTASGSYYNTATTDYWVTNFYIRSSLRTETDDSFERPGIAADSFAVGYKKLNKSFVYTSTESENIDLRFINRAQDVTSDNVYDGYNIDSTTGEMIEATASVFKKTFYVKPGSKLKLVSGSPTVFLYDYDMKYIGRWARQNVDLEIVIPNEAHYMRISVGGRLLDQYSKEVYARLVTNCLVDDARLYYKDLVVDLSDNNKADISQYLTNNATEFERKLMYETIKASNRMRGGIRIASFNTFGTGGKGQSNWDALKELFQKEGIEIVGMQEVQDPLGETEGNRVFSDVMSGWHLKSFSNAVSFMSNSRMLATTGDFEIVSSEEVKYTDQTGYGNRHYVRNEVRLPLFNDKKWSDHLKMSVYNTQLEIHRTYGPRQAAELMTAVQNDPNPFIVVLGDFNDESMFSKPVFDVFTNAGLKPVIANYYQTSTETNGRSCVDNIFVSDRIDVLHGEVLHSGSVLHLQGGVMSPISDHNMVIGDIALDYSDIVTVKPILTNCSLSGIDGWFSRNDSPLTITVVPEDGYTISSIEVGDGEWLTTNQNYPSGVVTISGDAITIDPSGVCDDMYIRATAVAS